MVRHIIFWTLKESEDKQAIAGMLQKKFDKLLGVVPGLLTIEIRAAAGDGNDLVLYSEFDSMEALAAYQIHPDHVAIKAVVHAHITDRVCRDFES